METANLLKTHFHEIIDEARFAPSVHNTQPWLAKLSGDAIVVMSDHVHTLRDGDPTGREHVISLGIFAEAIILSAQNKNLCLDKAQYGENGVTISFTSEKRIERYREPQFFELLKNRWSDRSVYRPLSISQNNINLLENVWSHPDVKIWVKTDPGFIKKVAALTSNGIRLALSSPGFRKELASYLTLPWSKKKRGIAVKSLYIPYVLAILEPLLMPLGIGVNAEARLEKKRWDSASAVILITAEGDMPEYWLLVGRAYLHVSLAIEKIGLSQATSAAIVEASSFHEDIEELLGTEQRILSMIRVGKGSKRKEFSPRLDYKDIITSTE